MFGMRFDCKLSIEAHVRTCMMLSSLIICTLDPHSYLKSNNILCTNKFGFRKNSNTSDAIIEFLDYVYSSLDKNQSTIAVYLDFSKAFDC